MTENTTGFNRQSEARHICARIRSQTIQPWSWLFAAANPCVSCEILTGGHPEVMACYCPRVNEQMIKKLEHEETPAEPAATTK